PLDQIQYVLGLMTDTLPVDLACLYFTQLRETVIADATCWVSDATRGDVQRFLRDEAEILDPEHYVCRLEADDMEGLPYRSGVIFPLSMHGQIGGLLTLLCEEVIEYTPEHLAKLEMPVALMLTILERCRLQGLLDQNLTTARSILVTAEAIADSPSPQQIVNILHAHLFEPHISSCAMLLYGPRDVEHPNSPFEYLEIAGSWSKRVGSGVGRGIKLYLKDYPELLQQLDEHKILVFHNVDGIRNRFDPLIRGFFRAERVRSMTMLALQSAERQLGVIVIATDKVHEFSPAELDSYRTVSEFLAISAVAQILQQQHDYVQQGRAALLDAVTDGVVMVVPRGLGGHVLTVNQRFTNLFDVSEPQVQGLSLPALLAVMQIPEDTRKCLREEWLSTPVRDPAMRRGEFSMIHSDGHPVEVAWYSAPVYQDGIVLGRIYIFHDATAEHTAKRLRAAFLSRISHELRTPLTSIRGFAEFILEATGDQLPDLAREYTEIILDSAKHLNRVFTDMIEITRADAGEIKLNKGEAHLPDIIINGVARMELRYKARSQQVIMELDDDLPTVEVDVDRMLQVMTNLLTNAIKYSPEGGKIHVTTTYIGSDTDLPKSAPPDVMLPAILVKIVDEGGGLTAEEAEKVFLPFFRTDAAHAQKAEGVGLGLAVTRSIVEVHRGKIWAEPKRRGKGGCFLFTVPTVRNGMGAAATEH
ncbi:MAG: hypothetical protein GYB67_07805, partial [Chloroflexi bacterium]|nr:hypothetical protein [Chloroflexota bacterium]